jgi:hypothetical protein
MILVSVAGFECGDCCGIALGVELCHGAFGEVGRSSVLPHAALINGNLARRWVRRFIAPPTRSDCCEGAGQGGERARRVEAEGRLSAICQQVLADNSLHLVRAYAARVLH